MSQNFFNKSLILRHIKICSIALGLGFTSSAIAKDASVIDNSLNPKSTQISPLYDNIVSVQKKAKAKSKNWIFNPYFSADFSDAPYTMYATALDFGYALNEYWEVYVEYVPLYITNQRSIAQKVSALTLANGQQASIDLQKAKSAYSVEINWSPIYGKDAWGPHSIIRSDTFVHLGLGMVNFETTSGFKSKLGLGKTFFFSKLLNVRMMAGGAFIQIPSSTDKQLTTVGLLEAGLVYYF